MHLLIGSFIFVPVIMWQLIAFPVASVIPALLTMAAALYGYFHVSVEERVQTLIVVFASTATWICYGLYEHQMAIWARTVIAPIRVDLLIIDPLLYYLSLLLIRFVRCRISDSKRYS